MNVGHTIAAERLLRRVVGRDAADHAVEASVGYPVPIPLTVSKGLFVVDGIVVPKMAGGGFSSLSDLISEATTGGKLQPLVFTQQGTLAVANAYESHWTLQGTPGAGVVPGATAAGGSVPTRTTQGALGQANPGGTDTLHIASFTAMNNVTPGTMILYDRLWHASVTMSSGAGQSIPTSSPPTRYTGAAAAGNIIWLEVGTSALGATAHSWTVAYVDDQGNVAENASSITGITSCQATRLDHAGGWFVPLNSGDLGVRSIATFTWGATITGGPAYIVIARPLAICPMPVAGLANVMDGINSAFNLVQVQTDACLNFMTLRGAGSSATAYGGQINLVSG